jgi:hypothetical protein
MNPLYLITGYRGVGTAALSRIGACETRVVRMNIYSFLQLIFTLRLYSSW